MIVEYIINEQLDYEAGKIITTYDRVITMEQVDFNNIREPWE